MASVEWHSLPRISNGVEVVRVHGVWLVGPVCVVVVAVEVAMVDVFRCVPSHRRRPTTNCEVDTARMKSLSVSV